MNHKDTKKNGLASALSIPPFFVSWCLNWLICLNNDVRYQEFKPLKELGAIALSESSELKFYVDEFKGHRYGSIAPS